MGKDYNQVEKESRTTVLVPGGDVGTEVRTEEVYGCQSKGAMGEIPIDHTDRPTTATAKGLMVKSQDLDTDSLYVPGTPNT